MEKFAKAITVILTLALLCTALSVSALAAAVTPTGDTTKDVNGTYVAGAAASNVYSVTIAWGDMAFTYTDTAAGTWDPTTMTYTGSVAAAWSCTADANKITITNKSNAAIYATFSFTDNDADAATITGLFYNEAAFSNLYIPATPIAAATPGNGVNGTATVEEVFLSVSGALPSSQTSAAKIGSVTITISDSAA